MTCGGRAVPGTQLSLGPILVCLPTQGQWQPVCDSISPFNRAERQICVPLLWLLLGKGRAHSDLWDDIIKIIVFATLSWQPQKIHIYLAPVSYRHLSAFPLSCWVMQGKWLPLSELIFPTCKKVIILSILHGSCAGYGANVYELLTLELCI